MTLIDVYGVYSAILYVAVNCLVYCAFFRQIQDVIECYTNWLVCGSFLGPPFFCPAFSCPAFSVDCKVVLHFPVLHFPVLHFPASAKLSCIFLSCIFQSCKFQSYIFQPCSFVLHFPVHIFHSIVPLLSFIFQSCIFSRSLSVSYCRRNLCAI